MDRVIWVRRILIEAPKIGANVAGLEWCIECNRSAVSGGFQLIDTDQFIRLDFYYPFIASISPSTHHCHIPHCLIGTCKMPTNRRYLNGSDLMQLEHKCVVSQ